MKTNLSKNILDVPELKINETPHLEDPDIFKVKEHLLDREKFNNYTTDNNWNEENIETIHKWSDKIKSLLVNYKNSAIKYQKIVNLLNIIPFIVSGLIMIISFLQVSLNSMSNIIDQQKMVWLNIILCIVNFIFAIFSSLMSSLIKMKGYNNKITNLNKIIEKLYGFKLIIDTELSLPNKFKIDAIQFIKKYSNYYSILLDIDIDFSLEDIQI